MNWWTYRFVDRPYTPALRQQSASALLKLSRSKLPLDRGRAELDRTRSDTTWRKRDPDFAIKLANVLHVYKEVEMGNEYHRGEDGGPGMVTISYGRDTRHSGMATTDADSAPLWVGSIQSPPAITSMCEWYGVACWRMGFAQDGKVIETVATRHQQRRLHRLPQTVDSL